MDLIELIKEFQWIDIREYNAEMIQRHQFCPACGAAKIIGHEPWCKIKRVLDDAS